MKKINVLLMSAALCGAGLGQAASQLRISDGTPGGTVVITDQGPGDINSLAGSVSYAGPVGANWVVEVAAGLSKPIAGSAVSPFMDLTTRVASQGAGSLTVEYTDTGFTDGGAVTIDIGGNTIGTVSYRSWANAANAPFGKTTLLADIGPLGGPTFAAGAASSITPFPVNPYSLTIDTIINHASAGISAFNADFIITPQPRAAIGDRVWFDTDGNGIQDLGEPGVPGVTVQLMDCEGTVVAVTNTDLNGFYLFSNLRPGAYNFHVIAPSGFAFTLQDQGLNDSADSDADASGNMTCTQLDSGEVDRTWDAGLILIPASLGGCRVTGGSNKQTNNFQAASITTPKPSFVSHGGQVGAPFSVGTAFTPNSPCISGEWEHNRHLQGNSLVGVFHASGNGNQHQFDSLLCACLPCDMNPYAVGVVGGICNPGDRVCGPEPRRAPANKICFSGVGDYTFTNGKKTVKAVFRVDIEDRGEGNSHASTPPPDRYRIRFWILDPSTGRTSDPNSAEGLALRYAASADPLTIASVATTENLKVNILPDIDDGGDMTQGNHQIHPATGATCK